MKFYVIPPTVHMDLAKMGDRIYVLAHLYLERLSYRMWVLERKKAGWFITLDNSAAERSLVSEHLLLEITKELQPNEVIAPDILFDKDATIEATTSFIKKLNKQYPHGNAPVVFGCPQGKTKEEWLDCYKWMLNNNSISRIGLSKIAVPKAFLDEHDDRGIKEARRIAVAYLDDHNLIHKAIHCLGMGDPREYRFYKGINLIQSTDSCYSILAAIKGVDFSKGEFERFPTPEKYFDYVLTREQLLLAERNILWMRQELH